MPATGKPAHNAHPPAVRDRAVKLYQEKGLATAARETGITKGTISKWAKLAGVIPAAETEARRAQTAAAVAERVRQGQERMSEVALQASKNALLAGRIANKRLEIEDRLTDDEGNVSLEDWFFLATAKANGTELRDLAAVEKNAVNTYQLLTGGDTERDSSGVVLMFTAPEPSARKPPVIVDQDGRPVTA